MKTKFLIVLLAGFLTACAGEQFEDGAPPAPDQFVLDKEYTIGVGDELQIEVWRNEDLSVEVPVRPDGMISVALIGDIAASGKSANQLSTDLRVALEAYIRNPQVTVIVANPVSTDYQLRVRVTGAVEDAVSAPFRKGMTVVDLVLEAGGMTDFASGNKARLYRKVDGEVKVYSIRLDDIVKRGKLDTNYPLAPGDIVTIPERSF